MRAVSALMAAWMASAFSVEAKDYQPFTPTDGEVEAVEMWIAEHLSDPWSAEFRALAASSEDNGRAYFCGQVNAKNKMGGYVGWTPYFVMADAVTPLQLRTPMIGDSYNPGSVASVCRSYGITLDRK